MTNFEILGSKKRSRDKFILPIERLENESPKWPPGADLEHELINDISNGDLVSRSNL